MVKKILMRTNPMFNKYKFYWDEGDLHTNFGTISESEFESGKGIVKSGSGKEFFCFSPSFVDQIDKIKRGPQTLLLKDIGLILMYTGVGKDSLVVDAGAGCGLLAACLGRVSKKVISYEMNNAHAKIAKRNLKFLKVDNVEVKEKNIYDGIDETDVDVLTLDLPEPWQVLPSASKALKNGAMVVTYLPSITQVHEFVNSLPETFLHLRTVELLEREWYISGRKVRPKSQMQGHTAFLTFVRKV